MSIRLKWVNPNPNSDQITVYRSLSPFTADDLPEPLAMVTGTNEYHDTTALINTVYYYSLGCTVEGDEVISPNRCLANYPYTGPGRDQPLRGDFTSGYYGRLAETEMFTAAELVGLTGNPGGTLNTTTNEWHKFIHDGKVLFCPTKILVTGVSWDQLYGAGLVYGNLPDAPLPNGFSEKVPQNHRVQKGEHEFIVRLMRANQSADYNRTSSAGDSEGEVMALWARGIRNVTNVFPLWDDLHSNDTTATGASYSLLMERAGAGTSVAVVTNALSITTSGASSKTNLGWRPVLELVM